MAELDLHGSGAPLGAGGARPGRKDIDLYDSALFQRKRELPAWAPLVLLAAALLGGAGVTGWMGRERAVLAAQAKELDVRLAGLRPAAPSGKADASQEQALQAEIARMRARLDQMSSPEGALPVSTVLESLAAATLDGVWLTRIQFDRPGRQLSLEGRTRDARLLPRYLQSLGRQPAFAGLPLSSVNASRPERNRGEASTAIVFRIVSATGATEADAPPQRAPEAAPVGKAPAAPAPPAGGAAQGARS